MFSITKEALKKLAGAVSVLSMTVPAVSTVFAFPVMARTTSFSKMTTPLTSYLNYTSLERTR